MWERTKEKKKKKKTKVGKNQRDSNHTLQPRPTMDSPRPSRPSSSASAAAAADHDNPYATRPTSSRLRSVLSSGATSFQHLRGLTQSPQLRTRMAALSLSVTASDVNADSGARPVDVDNIVVLEIGNRFVRAGLAGHASPSCVIPVEFGWRRVATVTNDPVYHSLWTLRELSECTTHTSDASDQTDPYMPDWYHTQPLKRIEVVLETMLKHAFSQELLLDPRQQRVAVPENPLWPEALRAVIAKVLLKHLHVSSLVFLPSPVLDLISAGLRSGIVVDLGWEESFVYPVYDLRLLMTESRATVRGSKLLHSNVKKVLTDLNETNEEISFETVERVVSSALYAGADGRRMMGIPLVPKMVVPGMATGEGSSKEAETRRLELGGDDAIEIPNNKLQKAVSNTFFGVNEYGNDDDEQDLARLVSDVIFNLSMDVRGATQSTIVFVGGASAIPGLQSKVLQEIRRLLRKKDIAAASSVMAVRSMGAWTGASLYLSSLGWYFAQDERIRLPGELSRDRYMSLGYHRTTTPFGVIY